MSSELLRTSSSARRLICRARSEPRSWPRHAGMRLPCNKLVLALLAENDRLSGFLSDPPYQKAGASAAHLLAPGTRLGRYTIVDQLGAGGMGVVYRARDEKLERLVAIKMVSKGVLASEEARRHFRKEALALAKLNHPRIASVYDVGEQDGADFLVMELVQGAVSGGEAAGGTSASERGDCHCAASCRSLGRSSRTRGDSSRSEAGECDDHAEGRREGSGFWPGQAAGARSGCHDVGGGDAGLLGTPVYMSPEQALGKSVDARTDLWSLGVLYYESLAGRPPFAGNSSLDVLHAITTEPLPSIRAIRPELPPLAEHIVTRALEKDCDLRYQRAVEMETDLKRLARDLDPGWPSSSSVSVASSAATR